MQGTIDECLPLGRMALILWRTESTALLIQLRLGLALLGAPTLLLSLLVYDASA